MRALASMFTLTLIIFLSIAPIFPSLVLGQQSSNSNYYAPPTIRFASNYGVITNGSIIFDPGNFNITIRVDPPYSVNDLSTHGTPMTTGITIVSALYKTNWQQLPTDFSAPTTTITNIPHGYRQIQVTATVGTNLIKSFAPFTVTPISYTGSQTLDFTVESPPTISILSPENETYGSDAFPLLFNINGSFEKLDYRLDNNDNVTISGNSTLTGLPHGTHSLVLYASDTADNTVASRAVYFTYAKPMSLSNQTIAVFLVLIIVVAITFLVFWRYRKTVKTTL